MWSINNVWIWVLQTSFDALQHYSTNRRYQQQRGYHAVTFCFGTAESMRHELFLQQDPHPRGGWRPMIEHPWDIIVASSGHHADDAGRTDTLNGV